jgi:hypothetical protein
MKGDEQPQDATWSVARHWRQREAEMRINLVRIAAVGIFYLIHLVHHWAATHDSSLLKSLELDTGGVLTDKLHVAVTCIVVAWTMLAVLVHAMLREGRSPRWLSVGATFLDVILLTAALLLSSGAASPLVAGYFLIVMMAGLRLDLRLVWETAGLSIAGYMFVLGCTRWPQGFLLENILPAVPRYQQLMMVAALALSGVIVGQWIRHARKLAGDLARASRQGIGP